jgi:hypothetical protein
MNLNRQVISPRTFALGGIFVALLILKAASAFGAECPNHCSEERIAAYAGYTAAEAAQHAAAERADRAIERARALNESRGRASAAAIRSVGYVCDDVYSVASTDAVPGVLVLHVGCDGGRSRYTLVVTHRIVVYTGWLDL